MTSQAEDSQKKTELDQRAQSRLASILWIAIPIVIGIGVFVALSRL